MVNLLLDLLEILTHGAILDLLPLADLHKLVGRLLLALLLDLRKMLLGILQLLPIYPTGVLKENLFGLSHKRLPKVFFLLLLTEGDEFGLGIQGLIEIGLHQIL